MRRAKSGIGEVVLDTIVVNGFAAPMVMVRPLVVYWFLTTVCHRRCPHCIAQTVQGRAQEPDRKTLFALARTLVQSGVPWVVLTGGEPLLRPELAEIVAYFSRHGVACCAVTSGDGLTSRLLEDLHRARLARILVSVDGPQDTHDRHRGVGSHAAAMAALKTLRAGRVPFGLSATMHADNTHAGEYLRDLARDSGCFCLYVNEYIPNGPGRPQSLRPLSAPMRDQLYTDLHRLRTEDFFSPWAGSYALDIVSPLSGAWAADSGCGRASKPHRSWGGRVQEAVTLGCGAGNTLLAVTSDGDVHPCYGWNDRLGNLLATPLDKIWASPRLEQIRREYIYRCGQCRYVLLCGSCPARRHNLGEDPATPDPSCPIARR